MTARIRRASGSRAAAGLDADANVFGALSLAVADRITDEITTGARPSRSGAAALSALYHFLESPTVDRLRQVIGLTHSGTVRLLDELAASGLVERRRGADARSRVVFLTPAGRRAAVRVGRARAALLMSVLAPLSPEERRTFAGLTARVLLGLRRGPGAVRWICRLCDTHACGRDRGECPLAN